MIRGKRLGKLNAAVKESAMLEMGRGLFQIFGALFSRTDVNLDELPQWE